MCCLLFHNGWAGARSTISAVVADVVVCSVVDNGLVVDIVNIRDVHIIHRAVVIERSVSPISALIADPAISEAVVHATVEADLRTPVAAIPRIGVATPTPITRRPQHASLGSHHPCAWYPEVPF